MCAVTPATAPDGLPRVVWTGAIWPTGPAMTASEVRSAAARAVWPHLSMGMGIAPPPLEPASIRRVADALMEGFTWNLTPQGNAYWLNIYQEIIALADAAEAPYYPGEDE